MNDSVIAIILLAIVGISILMWEVLRQKGLSKQVAKYVLKAEELITGDGRGAEKKEWVLDRLGELPIIGELPRDFLSDLIDAHVAEANAEAGKNKEIE